MNGTMKKAARIEESMESILKRQRPFGRIKTGLKSMGHIRWKTEPFWRKRIGVDRGALIKVWLHEKVKEEKGDQ